MQLSQVFQGQNVRFVGSALDVDVRSFAYDSRQVHPGSLFAALGSVHSRGEEFIASAVERGAVAVLAHTDVETDMKIEPVLVLSDRPRFALARAARQFFHDPAAELKMVGVTGTNGKTTVSTILGNIMQAAGWGAGVMGTLGIDYTGNTGPQHVDTALTTPESVDTVRFLRHMRDHGVEGVAMEVSSHALVQGRVAGVQFDVGVFTNLSHDHLDYHPSLNAYLQAKVDLFRHGLKPGGKAVVNIDDAQVMEGIASSGLNSTEIYGFSVCGAEAFARVKSATLEGSGTAVELQVGDELRSLHSPLLGRFNIENILAAVATARLMNIEWPAIEHGVASLQMVPGRMECVSVAHEPLVLVDYAHTPDALEKVLRTLREMCKGRLFCVFGCGGDRDKSKRAPMGKAAGRFADVVLVTSDNPRTEDPIAIIEDILQGLEAYTFTVEADRALAISKAIETATSNDIVLIAGKGHEDYQIIGTQKHHFDDRECARQALKNYFNRGTEQ